MVLCSATSAQQIANQRMLSNTTLKCKSKEKSRSWEGSSRSATHEIPSLLRQPEVYYSVQKRRPPVSWTCIAYPTAFTSILILSCHIHLSIQGSSFTSRFTTKHFVLTSGRSTACYLHHPSRPPWLHHSVLIIPMKGTNSEAPDGPVFSKFPSLLRKIFPSVPRLEKRIITSTNSKTLWRQGVTLWTSLAFL